ncbi:tRNA-splicing ligase RtcB [Giardia muris]|uniref:3'-phosphate/5'-hydroxy nucleic acid ligase n=1 Tax=Giardia muris TaxID=5742 RepID=A0A4Z1T2G3_GIAMU|nr:tRNA-splicing ligase RtcB [Giardia muris]|eukprot:TNJ27227.1 tRNA-splicing ligase RtcB [Giardia muris]
METSSVPPNVRVYGCELDAGAREQVIRLAQTPFFSRQPVRIMPDCHAGKGCVIGFSAPYEGALIPSVIGVDIGCGMLVVRLGRVAEGDSASLQAFLEKLDAIVHATVPAGAGGRLNAFGHPVFHENVDPHEFDAMLDALLPWLARLGEKSEDAITTAAAFRERFTTLQTLIGHSFSYQNLLQCCGTLGSGNHFLELDKDDTGELLLVVHTGSRGYGFSVASAFMELAQLVTRTVLGLEGLEKARFDLRRPLHRLVVERLEAFRADKAETPWALRSDVEKQAFFASRREELKGSSEYAGLTTPEEQRRYLRTQLNRIREELEERHNKEAFCPTEAQYDLGRIFGVDGSDKDHFEAIARYRKEVRTNPELSGLFSGLGAEEYLEAMGFVQLFARLNRLVIACNVYRDFYGLPDLYKNPEQLQSFFERAYVTDCAHNYVELATRMIRKGCIRANVGDELIIPINMRDGVIYARGRGNDAWNCTAPHGAGRVLSRQQARLQISLERVKEQMKGIHTTCLRPEVVDEAPDAYKGLDQILPYIQETCDVLSHWHPLWNFKGLEVGVQARKKR